MMTNKNKNKCPHCTGPESERKPLWEESESDHCEIEDFKGGKQLAICRNGVEFDWSFINIKFCPICGRDFNKPEES
ncbi:hypothetical protein [Enterococcus sp. AZ196]|uniref:hypothetical protein n=1 Tax=Enterococcus sp. AZ196 TaxID=2774659 RepID=UPI003D27B346